MGEGGIIPGDVILLVSSDLQARVKLESAVRPLGFEVVTRRTADELGDLVPVVVVLDLDQLGVDGAERWTQLLGGAGARIIGFFSHIDAELGRRAGELGIEAVRRGRFWKQIAEILGAAGGSS